VPARAFASQAIAGTWTLRRPERRRLNKEQEQGGSQLKKVAALGLTLLLTAAAPSHYVYSKAIVSIYDPTQICTQAYAEASDGTNQEGYGKGYTHAMYFDRDNGQCEETEPIFPAGKIKVQMTVEYQLTNGQYAQCNSPTDWSYNPGPDWKVEQTRNWNAPCGTTFYKIKTSAYIWTGGAWRGGTLWSPAHWWCKNGC